MRVKIYKILLDFLMNGDHIVKKKKNNVFDKGSRPAMATGSV